MKALVTGGCGFIGTNLVTKLIKHNWEICVVDNLSSGHNKLTGVSYAQNSITQRDNMFTLIRSFQPDVLFHLAAVPRVAYSVEHPYETAVENVMGTISILDAVRRTSPKCRVVASSSSSVYGGADMLPTPEICNCNPKSPYALEKFQLEQWCKLYSELYDLDIVCLRYFNVIGPHSLYGGAYSTVLSAWLYHLYVDASVPAFLEGDGKQTRDFCDVANVVQANLLCAYYGQMDNKKFSGDIFNIAKGSSHDLLYIKKLLESISGKQLHLEMRPERIGDVKHTLADISKAKSILGYEPTTDFDQQVIKMAEWYKNHYPKLCWNRT